MNKNQIQNDEQTAHTGFRSIVRLFFFLFLGLGTWNLALGAPSKIDSLLTLLKKEKDDTNKVVHLNQLCWEYKNIGDYATALHYGNVALQLAGQLNFPRGITSSYNNIGIIYWKQGNYAKALENYFASLKIKEKIGDRKGMAAVYNNMGIIYSNIGNYDKALENLFASLKIKEAIGNKRDIASSYNNIGMVYAKQATSLLSRNSAEQATREELLDKALENHVASLKINKEIGDKTGIASSYDNIGMVYAEQAAAAQLPLSGNSEGQATRGKLLDMALENYFASLQIIEELSDKHGASACYINIANVYMNKLNYVETIAWFQKGMRIAKEIGSKQLLMDAYKGLSEVKEKTGDYRNAYKYHQLYSQIKDSIFNEESSRQIADMQIKYETEKKEKENTLLAQQNRIQQMEIEQEKEKKNRQFIIFMGFLAFTVITFTLLYYRNKFRQKSMMEKESHLQQKLRFKAVMDAEEKERRRIAQELHDGLGQLLSTVKLNVSAAENFTDASHKTPFKNSLSLLDDACDEVRTISHNMMPGVLIRLGFISALRELVRRINDSKQLTVAMEADFEERFDESAEVGVYRIAQEVLNNMIKHAQAKSISIKLNKKDHDFFMQITDDGIGFDTALIDKSEGMGWKNIYSRTALMNGALDVMSAPNAGTTIKFYFPLISADK